MRALIITPMPPPVSEADWGGMQRRMKALLTALSSRAEQIEIIHISPPNDTADPATQSAFWGIPVHSVAIQRRDTPPSIWSDRVLGAFSLQRQYPYTRYSAPGITQAIQARIDALRPDLIYADRLESMVALEQCDTTAPILLDLNDVEHKKERDQLRRVPLSLSTALTWARWPALYWGERSAVRRATAHAVCSQIDASFLRRTGFPGRTVVIPNSIALPALAPGLSQKPTILLLGSYAYPPNEAAATRLIERIWPLILAKIPGAQLIIAGKGSDTLPACRHNPPQVTFTGFVPDLSTLYGQTRIVCCPLLDGGGTRLKLIEAAAYARPMVSTAKGAEGLDFTPGHSIVIAETDTEIASACVALLQDDLECVRLGSAARLAAQAYDLSNVAAHIGTIIDELTGKAGARAI